MAAFMSCLPVVNRSPNVRLNEKCYNKNAAFQTPMIKKLKLNEQFRYFVLEGKESVLVI